MGRGRSFPQQLVHWTYVCACFVIILLSFVFTPLANLGKDSTSAASAAPPPPPEGSGYTYSRGIAINHSQVPSDQANFPVLISGTYSYLASVANGGRVQNSNGYDIIFTSDSGCATKLNHEVETYNATTGAVSYWVKAPTVSHSSDTTIYVCYGNSSITTDQSNKTGVWDANYKGVWHLPNGTSLNANDSTVSANNGTNHSATAASGKLYGGANFDGSSQSISVPQIIATNTTVEHWMYRTGSTDFQIMADAGWNNTDGFCTVLTSNLHAFVKHARAAVNTTISSPLNTWEDVVWTVGADNKARLYVNGVLSYTDTDTQTIISPTHGGSLGSRLDASGIAFKYFPGILDEVRISNIARSADWITTEYNNQNAPSTFYTVSGESGNRSPVANAGGPYSGLSQTSIQFNGGSSNDPDGSIASYSWNFGDYTALVSGASPSHSYSNSGTYTATLTVTDNGGATASAQVTVTATNRSPVANAGGPYSGLSQTSIQFNGGSSNDPDGSIAGYSWNFGDNTAFGIVASPSHSYSHSGPYTATLTVTDNAGATASTQVAVTATNRSPVASAGGPYSGLNQTSISFSGNDSIDTDGTITSYAWNFGDTTSGNNDMGSGVNPTHTYATAGPYTVTLTVTDNLGATASATASTTVTGTLDARLDPLNRTGGGGEDPLSRNFNWSIPLVGLSGRAGLDLGLSLSYNSLATWTRNGNAMSFDDDHGSPAPGFRLGFPVIQGSFYNSQAGKYSYIMITPSGSRLELRQVGASTKYQSVDSSYVLLDAGTMKLRTTDGTQLSYVWKGSDYECTEIKDRNGNFITINYDGLGRVATVKDTLSRTITFNYDTNSSLGTITQSWTVNGQTLVHPWATFAYTDIQIQTNFTNLTVYGPQNTIHALTQVKLADDSHFDFAYTSWGQVWKISQYTGETPAHLLNYRSYDLPADASTVQTNCPRFTVRHDWAENWNRDNTGTAQEVNTFFDAPIDASLPDNSLQTVTMAKVKTPDGTYQQTYFAGNISGGAGSAPAWKRGLPLLTDTFDSNNAIQRSAKVAWTQDDENISYQLNPRVTDTNISDPAGNHARTRTDYASTSLSDGTTVNLPVDTYEYQSNATTVLRRTHIVYNVNTSYTDLRIIGLPSAKYLCDGAQGEVPCNNDSGASLFSKVTFEYDESGSIQGTDAPVQHDNTNYTASFRVGRGNLSSVTRHDVVNTSQSTTSTFKYNTAGAVVATLDPLTHGVTISYADSFSDDNNSRNTLAYPTMVTDAGGFSSNMKYNYDFGGATRKQTPLPNVTDNEPGPVQTIEYDSLGRVQKVKSLFNNAYTRYEYPASQNRVDTYATIQDNAGEAHSFKITDGHGRVIASAADHPGSTGGYSGQLISYDTMGRVIKQSNPTETSASSTNPYDWAATGDDATSNGGTGWVNTQQTYDWKSRPLVTTNTDNTYKSATYGGCGCAGSQVITLTDEVNRQQKIYSDVLGRQLKTEILNTDLTVYSTTTNTFNARDQLTLVRQYQGPDTSTVYQDTTMSYDGYGRLLTKHAPEQQVDSNNSSSTDHTSYVYNSDDTVYSVTDARGALSTYGYNLRRQVTSATHTLSGQATISMSYGYDAVGNRISMTDGLGSQSYSYNQLSQMTSETRTFSGPNSYTINYGYNLGGELKSVTDPSNSIINYVHDAIGRVSNVTGTNYSITQFLSNVSYRASGATKEVAYGNGRTLSLSYNQRLQVTHFEIPSSGSLPSVMAIDYQYNDDGRLSYSHDLLDSRFDRGYQYDHEGRIKLGLSGADANGSTPTTDRPYRELYGYDAFDHLTVRNTRHWSKTQAYISTDTFTDNRRNGWQYDAEGNLTDNLARQYTYDAAGRMSTVSGSNLNQFFDGDGQRVKTTEPNLVTYYLRSSVLSGQVIEELDSSGSKQRGFVYAGGKVIAEQVQNGSFGFVHEEPSGTSVRKTDGELGGAYESSELDPFRQDAELEDPYLNEPYYNGRGEGGALFPGYGNITQPSNGCALDGVYGICDWGGNAVGSISTAFWGRHIADLPGFGTNWGSFAELGLWEYGQRLAYTRGRNGMVPPTREGTPRGTDQLEYVPQNSYDPRADFRDYAEQLSKDKSKTDCLKLALMIYKAGQVFGGRNPFSDNGSGIIHGLMAGLTEYKEVNLGGRQGPSNANYRVGVFRRDDHYGGGFGDSGFASGQDGSNQVRHFTFYLGAGWGIGSTLANQGLYREEGTHDASVPDVGLGQQGTDLGTHFNGNYKQLAQDVWHRVCGQSSNLNLP